MRHAPDHESDPGLPELTELTLALGDADLYVHLGHRIETPKSDTLYEAVLTDRNGSRIIYIGRKDLEACLKDSPILRMPAAQPPGTA